MTDLEKTETDAGVPVQDRGDLEGYPPGTEERTDREIGGPRGGEHVADRGDDDEGAASEDGQADTPAP